MDTISKPTSTEADFIPLPPLEIISQITTFKFFQDSVRSIYENTSTKFNLQIIISQISSSQLVYAWRQQRSNRTNKTGEIEKVLRSKAEEIQTISNKLIENAKLLGSDTDLIRINYNGNTNELFILPDSSNDLVICLIIEK